MSIFKRYCSKHNIVLQKGHNSRIVLTLAWNSILLLKIRIHKWLHGIQYPIVHYYAVCWNEEKMLPFVFDYYDKFVDYYTIYDNCSTDTSQSIIESHPNAKIIKFASDGINDAVLRKIKNTCWKKSRGKADYVIVCDIDEFLYHEHLVEFLSEALSEHYSILCTTGYHMYSTTYPIHKDNTLITDLVKTGVHDFYFDKQIIFDPHRIVEINYEVGAHKAYPLGIVKTKDSNGALKMLHYKNLSLDHILHRISLYTARLSDINMQNGWGQDYLKEKERITEEFNANLQKSSKIIP